MLGKLVGFLERLFVEERRLAKEVEERRARLRNKNRMRDRCDELLELAQERHRELLKLYFAGEANPPVLHSALRAAERALTDYEDHCGGGDPGPYYAQSKKDYYDLRERLAWLQSRFPGINASILAQVEEEWRKYLETVVSEADPSTSGSSRWQVVAGNVGKVVAAAALFPFFLAGVALSAGPSRRKGATTKHSVGARVAAKKRAAKAKVVRRVASKRTAKK